MKPDHRLLARLAVLCAVVPLASFTTFAGRDAVGNPASPTTGDTTATAVVGDAGRTGSAERSTLAVVLDASMFGRSGALQARVVEPGTALPVQLAWSVAPAGLVRYRWRPVVGTGGAGYSGTLEAGDVTRVPTTPGVYELELMAGGAAIDFGDALRVVVTVPFDSKREGRIGPYLMGTWPTENETRDDGYAPPAGFIEVTEVNRALPLSRNFTVGQFLTKDQDDVWPKYVAVDPRLVDKLELVLLELRAMGIRADRMVVMSGFRTPHYNRFQLGNPPTSLSRHQFGDAADVWVDNEDDWYMSDLNGDGRRDIEDARVMLRAVERVEKRYPELIGGAGLYRANRVRGPFIHIDVRGQRARW
jgi:uncharacterized protein YcbK (DUF882 family)